MIRKGIGGFGTLVLLALLSVLAVPLHAQQQATPAAAQRAPATVALVDDLPRPFEGYEAVVLLRPHGTDLILLRREVANGELLDAAVRTLLHARQTTRLPRTSYHEAGEVALGIHPSPSTAAWAERHLPHARRVIEQLQSAPARSVTAVGHVPAITIHLPDPRG
jgi:hypothetical protein